MEKTQTSNRIKIGFSVLLVFVVIISLAWYPDSPFQKPETSAMAGGLNVVPPPQNSIADNEFMIGVMDCAFDNLYANIPDLHLNAWHKYTDAAPSSCNSAHGWFKMTYNFLDWIPNDRYYNATSGYGSDISARIEANRNAGMRTIMDRPKIQYLAFGQRSFYQCEQKTHLTSEYSDYDFYTYNYSVDNGIDIYDIIDNDVNYGNNHKVKKCVVIENGPGSSGGYIDTNLNARHEQSSKGWTNPSTTESNMNFKQRDDLGFWYIMPYLRADKNYINNNSNWDNPICRIDILDWNGNPVLDYPNGITLYSRNFRANTQTEYNGSYVNEFYFDPYPNPPKSIKVNEGQLTTEPDHGFTNWMCGANDTGKIYVDYRIYWYGQCNAWFDYVCVENEPAHELFNPDDPNQWSDQIRQEVDLALTGSGQTGYVPNQFYIEEFEFNNIPCIGKVNQIIQDEASQNGVDLSLMINLNYDLLKVHVPQCPSGTDFSAAQLKRFLVDSAKAKTVVFGTYPLAGNEQGSGSVSFHPSTLTDKTYSKNEGILSYKVSPPTYDTWLQYHLDTITPGHDSFLKTMRLATDMQSNAPDLRFILLHQTHAWWTSCNCANLKEPSNEELAVMANLAVTYGAKGILYFTYKSYNDFTNGSFWGRGLTQPCSTESVIPTPLTSNVYSQNKWQAMGTINYKLKAWGPTLMSFDNTQTNSYIFRLERNHCLNESYFFDIITYKPGTGIPQNCVDDNPFIGQNPPQGLTYECYENRYLQAATFKEYSPNKRTYPYFMIVNRRCSPYINESSEDNRGGKRDVRVIFDGGHSELSGFNDWIIINVEDGSVAGMFNKTVLTLVDLGWYMPGEGKLYHLLPTAKVGGELLADEVIESGEEFTCEDTVWTNGYDLTIEDGVTIHFSDSAKFVVNGGTFQMGIAQHSGPNTIDIDAEQGNSWKGFEFDTCNVKIYGVNFSGLANDSIAMLTMIDCPVIDIRSNSFTLGSNNNVSAIDINYSGSYGSSLNDNVYIANNIFPTSSSVLPYVKVMAYSGITTPVIVEGNNFTGTSTALFLNNIQGGAIKSNLFTGFGTAVTALSSSLDVFSNTVSSTANGSYGFEALEGTELKMSYAGGLLVGGRNSITNSSSGSDNIYLENSYFLMDEGENIFDIGTSSYHLNGWFPDSYNGGYRETENCFKVQSSVVDPPLHYVTLGEQGNQITDFEFTPYLTGCTQGGEGDMMVINLGNGIYDTIGIMGEGGSYSSKYTINPKTIYDSISISMRYRNYANVKTLCLQLLNSYPDSVQSLGAVSKLYLAVSKTDTTTQGITDLKTLYENLILNHQSNISLVKRCNYYVQKCKVLLHQYSSALSGFQQIINQNPASYEGLIARWDYMATSLLMQGQGGSERETPNVKRETGIWNIQFDKSYESDESDKFDNDKFSKEERKQIKQAVTTALEVSKSTVQKRREVLTELSTRGDVKATKQLRVLKSLEQTVKVEKPKNIVEHMKIVSSDIQKVFVNPNAGKNTNTTFIPQVFHLSQNYPNPFNPITKINYDIPQNSIVKLTIYDILGREVIKLVNNEFKQPGRYVVVFNGTNLASGVYFYRLEAGDFIDSKKMVLVK